MKLQEISGLSDADPLHRFLGIVDGFAGEIDWSEIHDGTTKEQLAHATWLFLGHPATYREVKKDNLENYEIWLTEHEPGLAEILQKLCHRIGREGLTTEGIRLVMIWIIANLFYLKTQPVKGKFRKITSNWKVSAE